MSQSIVPPISSASARSAVRPLLRVLVKHPAELYQPVYLYPVEGLDLLRADVETLADADGIPAFFGAGAESSLALRSGSRGILFVEAQDAHAILERVTPDRLGGLQVVICGTQEPHDLDVSIRSWVLSGLPFSVTDVARAGGQQASMGPTLARCARQPGTLYNPIVLFGDRAALPFVADEATVRLEAGGVRRVFSFSSLDDLAADDGRSMPEGSAVVVRLPGAIPADSSTLRRTVESLLGDGVQVVLVVDRTLQDDMTRDLVWRAVLERAITLVVGDSPEKRGTRTAGAGEQGWPPLRDVVPGLYNAAPPTRGMAGNFSALGMGDILQTVVSGRLTGTLFVYTNRSAGQILFDEGQILGGETVDSTASADEMLGLRFADTPPAQAEISAFRHLYLEDAVCRMVAWPDAHFVFVPSSEPPLDAGDAVTLNVGQLVLEMDRRMDETPRRRRQFGGPGVVWRKARADFETHDPQSPLTRTWSAIDGTRTIAELARNEGLFLHEAEGAVEIFASDGAIERVRADDWQSPAATPELVVEYLLAAGLMREALDVLDALEASGSSTPAASLLRASLIAPQRPEDAWDVLASIVGRGASGALTPERQVRATLLFLLLGVRTGALRPEDAWQDLSQLLRSELRHEIRSPREYAILVELALRAGENAYAQQTLKMLSASRASDIQDLVSALQRMGNARR